MGNSHYFRSNLDTPPPSSSPEPSSLESCASVSFSSCFVQTESLIIFTIYISKKQNKTKHQLGSRSLQLASFSHGDSQQPRGKTRRYDALAARGWTRQKATKALKARLTLLMMSACLPPTAIAAQSETQKLTERLLLLKTNVGVGHPPPRPPAGSEQDQPSQRGSVCAHA